MQREEEEFLSDPATVFDPAHFRVLREIRRRIGLDYFGIDCGLDRSGKLVVFEVNASMQAINLAGNAVSEPVSAPKSLLIGIWQGFSPNFERPRRSPVRQSPGLRAVFLRIPYSE